jgi:superfamily II RNA helicase
LKNTFVQVYVLLKNKKKMPPKNSSKSSKKNSKLVNNQMSDDPQKTLLQFWKPAASTTAPQKKVISQPQTSTLPISNKTKPNLINLAQPENLTVIDASDEDDGDDLDTIKALDNHNSHAAASAITEVYENEEDPLEACTIGIGDDQLLSTQHFDTSGFDRVAGAVWIYPDNMPTRSYQYEIVQQCLHKNTMVVLPTGLGKTFIAAVVMLNFYRWYPKGKVIFMAPTKPLVSQQAEACHKTVGIPKHDMIEMTGNMNPEKRKILWQEKRMFFSNTAMY